MQIKNNTTLQIFLSMILGIVAGLILPKLMVELKFIGDIFLRLIQMGIILLVMGSVIEAIGSLKRKEIGNLGIKALIGFATTTIIAAIVGIIIANIIQPGTGINYTQELVTSVKGTDNPLGMSLNSDGLAIYLALACLTTAQFFGIEMSIQQQFIVVIMATLATLGTVTVPDGGLVALAIVLPAVGLPIEGVALLAGIDWFSGMFRTVLNVIDDVLVALLVAHSENEFDREIFDNTP